jgi:DNA polymerase-4
LGALGRRFVALANGVDARDVLASPRTRSIGSEHTLETDIVARADIEAHLRLAADTVARRLRHTAQLARGVRIKVKRTDFRTLTRQAALGEGTDVGAVLYARAAALLGDIGDRGPFRLVGLAAYDLESRAGTAGQLELVPAAGLRARRLETTLDAVAERFGAGAVQRAGDLKRDRGAGTAANLDFLGRGGDDDS